MAVKQKNRRALAHTQTKLSVSAEKERQNRAVTADADAGRALDDGRPDHDLLQGGES
jgi:hypothetical protein